MLLSPKLVNVRLSGFSQNFVNSSHKKDVPETVNIASQQSINVIKNIFSDVLSRESYTSSFFSPGGDELNIACYNKTHDGETFESTLKKFSEETYAVITDSKKTPYVWEG